jgi:hypothetical protein
VRRIGVPITHHDPRAVAAVGERPDEAWMDAEVDEPSTRSQRAHDLPHNGRVIRQVGMCQHADHCGHGPGTHR